MTERKFTLSELFAVIFVLSVLAAVLLPALAAGREKSRRSLCMRNMRQQGVAIAFYALDNKGHYPLRTPLPHSPRHHRGSVISSRRQRWGLLVLGQYLEGKHTECPANPYTHTPGGYGSATEVHDSYPVLRAGRWVMKYDDSVSGESEWNSRYGYLAGTDTMGWGGPAVGREAYYKRETGEKYYPVLTDEARGRRLLAGEGFYPGGFNHPPYRTWADVDYWVLPSEMTEGGHFLYRDGSVFWSEASEWADKARGERWNGLVGEDAEAAGAASSFSEYFPAGISLGFHEY